jgi:N-acetylmuramoyl-L-alanine amidase
MSLFFIFSVSQGFAVPSKLALSKQRLHAIFQRDVVSAYTKISTSKNQQLKFFTIVIDAGHGGKDPGAIGKRGTQEKKLVLSIAKILAQLINRDSEMRGVLTRSGDYYLPLRTRMQLARKKEADLFIAIHADAYFNNSFTGASVYALSKRGATSEAARWLAQRHNYAEIGDVEFKALQDRSLVLRSVLIDLAQTTTIRDSLRLGNSILQALQTTSSLHFTEVQQAPFMVLKAPDIPSVLVETGFITNPKEELRLKNPRYQRQIAQSIYQGIKRYIKNYAIYERM